MSMISFTSSTLSVWDSYQEMRCIVTGHETYPIAGTEAAFVDDSRQGVRSVLRHAQTKFRALSRLAERRPRVVH